jgi:MFS family permease
MATGLVRALSGSAALQAWQSPSFRRYFWSIVLSYSGRSLQQTVIGFIVYDLTGSNFLLGLVAFMQMVPQLLLAPLVGVIVDNTERRKTLAITFAVQAAGFVLLGLLALFGALTVPAIAAVVVVMGIAGSFTFPASSALLPNVVAREALQSGIAAKSVIGNISRIATPPVAGVLLDIAGVGAVLFLGAGLYLPAGGLVLAVPLLTSAAVATARPRQPFDPSRAVGTVKSDLRDALRYIRGNPLLRAALVNDILPFMCGMAYMAILPAIAIDRLEGDGTTLGILTGVAGVGALLGTLTIGALTGRGRRGTLIWVSMLGWGMAMAAIGFGASFSVILPALFVTGFFQSLYIVQNDTLVQVFTIDQFRGRVIAVQSMINGLMTFGFLAIGILAELAGLTVALAVNGLALATMGIVTLLLRPAMRGLD